MATKNEVLQFLIQFKNLAQDSSKFTFVPRKKNLDSIAEMGMLPRQVRLEILQLTYRDYVQGPDSDSEYPGSNVWVFGKSIGNEPVYIKLSDRFEKGVAICISFHRADQPLRYPLRTV